MPENNETLITAVIDKISFESRDQGISADSVVIGINKEGKTTRFKWTDRLHRGDFMYYRVNNKARAHCSISGMEILDSNDVKSLIDIDYEAWCSPGQEDELAAALAKQQKARRRHNDERTEHGIQRVVDDLIQRWLRTSIDGEEEEFLRSLLGWGASRAAASSLKKLAATHLGLGIAPTFKLTRATDLKPRTIEISVFNVTPYRTRKAVPMRMTVSLRPSQGDELRSLESLEKKPDFAGIVSSVTSTIVSERVTLDELHTSPPAQAREKIERAVDDRLEKDFGWRVATLNIDPDQTLAAASSTAPVRGKFTFQLRMLRRTWSGEISFVPTLVDRGKFHESSIESFPKWAQETAEQIASRILSSSDYENLLAEYPTTKEQIEDEIETHLAAIGYAVSGFNLNTDLPIELLTGTIRAGREKVRFSSNVAQVNVEMSYYFDYQIVNLLKVRQLLINQEDIKAIIEAGIGQVLQDEMHRVMPRDFYFHFDNPRGQNLESVQKSLLGQVSAKLEGFGAQIKTYQLRREEDEVQRKVIDMMRPARQGSLEKLRIPHSALQEDVVVESLVFFFVSFSKEYFYQFVMTKPEMKELAASVKTHLIQWLSDGRPEVFFRIANAQLMASFGEFVAPKIEEEFGVVIRIGNFVLSRHDEVLAPRPDAALVGERLKNFEGLLPQLWAQWRDAVQAGDSKEIDSLDERIAKIEKEKQRLNDELRQSANAQRRLNAQSSTQKLLSDGDNQDEGTKKAAT